MRAKDRHKNKLLEYLGNPENLFCNRLQMAVDVLEFKSPAYLYIVFTLDELNEIEAEALAIRRRKYSPEIAKVDKKLFQTAQGGDVPAAKLCYQRFEDWSERQRKEITSADGKDLNWTVEIVDPKVK